MSITIEKATNGYIIRDEETEEVIVFQKEYNSCNIALAAALNYAREKFEDEDESVRTVFDITGMPQ